MQTLIDCNLLQIAVDCFDKSAIFRQSAAPHLSALNSNNFLSGNPEQGLKFQMLMPANVKIESNRHI